MKKIVSVAVLAGTVLMPFVALAQLPGADVGGVTPQPVPTTINIPDIVGRTINWIFGLLLVIGAILILIAAFTYLTSGGDEEKTAKAKNWIIYAVVALVVAFIARGLLAIVAYLLGG